MRIYGVPECDIGVIHNGFSAEEFNLRTAIAARTPMRTRLGYRDTDKVVVFVANELERKGFVPLLRSIAALKDTDIQLLVVGSVSRIGHEHFISQIGLTGRVKFVGPTNEAVAYYGAADR